LELIFGAGPVVKLVLLVLVYFSVVSWAIIFLKFRVIHRATRDSEKFLDFFWAKKRFDLIGEGLKDYPYSPLVVLFREGYKELIKVQGRRSGEPWLHR
jgi:biopolymer transport protein TolQ